MATSLDQLKTRLGEIHDLRRANAVIGWDQQTYMPIGGSNARAEQSATLQKISHELFTADETGRLIAAAAHETGQTRSRLRRRAANQRHAPRLPQGAQSARRSGGRDRAVTGQAVDVWTQARAQSDWKPFEPYLQKIVDLNRKLADALGYTEKPYDALLDQYEPDMKTSDVKTVFDSIKPELIELVRQIAAKAEYRQRRGAASRIRRAGAVELRPGCDQALWL